MIRLSNWLRTPQTIQIPGFAIGVVPPAVDDGLTVRAGTLKITNEHYQALNALASDDPRKLALGKMEARADDNTAGDHQQLSVPSSLGDPVLAQARFIAQHSSY